MVNEISRRGFLRVAGIATGVAVGGLMGILAEADHIISSKKIISIDPYGSKFADVTYEDEKGQPQKKTIFHGHKLRHGDVVVDLHDYISSFGGSMPYGPFDVNKYIQYKKSRQK